jgi:hypothetical protein
LVVVTGTAKIIVGVMLVIVGLILMKLGLALTLTILLACVGIPMLLLGLPVMGAGIYFCLEGRKQYLREEAAANGAQTPGAANSGGMTMPAGVQETMKPAEVSDGGSGAAKGPQAPGDDLNNLRL